MISLTHYASYDSIRAALGVPAKELPDTVLDVDLYAFFVQTELDAIGTSLRADFETVDAISEVSRTTEQQALWDATRVFDAYATAVKCIDSLPQFSPKTISDGKAEVTRYSDSPYKFTAIEVRKSYLAAKKVLKDTFDAFSGETVADTVVLPLLGIATPSFDPVTGA